MLSIAGVDCSLHARVLILGNQGTTLFTQHFILCRIVQPVHPWPYRESRQHRTTLRDVLGGIRSHVPFRYDGSASEKRMLLALGKGGYEAKSGSLAGYRPQGKQ